jgi:hypothetical protein
MPALVLMDCMPEQAKQKGEKDPGERLTPEDRRDGI